MAKKKKSAEQVNDALRALAGGKKLSPADKTALRGIGEAIIDEFMRTVAHQDPERQTDEHRWRHLSLESAQGIVGINESEGELYLHVEAIIMKLPSDRDLIQALMREALELNCTLTGAARLGIRGAEVVLAATENMRSLHSPEEYDHLITFVMAFANTIDDQWQAKFGGTTRTRKAAHAAV